MLLAACALLAFCSVISVAVIKDYQKPILGCCTTLPKELLKFANWSQIDGLINKKFLKKSSLTDQYLFNTF